MSADRETASGPALEALALVRRFGAVTALRRALVHGGARRALRARRAGRRRQDHRHPRARRAHRRSTAARRACSGWTPSCGARSASGSGSCRSSTACTATSRCRRTSASSRGSTCSRARSTESATERLLAHHAARPVPRPARRRALGRHVQEARARVRAPARARGAAPRRADERRRPGLAARAVGAAPRVRARRDDGARLDAVHGRGRALPPGRARPPRAPPRGGRAGRAHRRLRGRGVRGSRGRARRGGRGARGARAGSRRLPGRRAAPRRGGARRRGRGRAPRWPRSAPRSSARSRRSRTCSSPAPGSAHDLALDLAAAARPLRSGGTDDAGPTIVARELTRRFGGFTAVDRRHVRGRAGRDLRLPRRERRRKVHDHPDAHRAARAHLGRGDGRGPRRRARAGGA